MDTLLNFYPIQGVVITLLAIIYSFFPKKWLGGQRNEYIHFALIACSSWWAVFMVARAIVQCLGNRVMDSLGNDAWAVLFYYGLILWIGLASMFLPFPRVKTNRHFQFLTIGFVLLSLFLLLGTWIVVMLSGGM